MNKSMAGRHICSWFLLFRHNLSFCHYDALHFMIFHRASEDEFVLFLISIHCHACMFASLNAPYEQLWQPHERIVLRSVHRPSFHPNSFCLITSLHSNARHLSVGPYWWMQLCRSDMTAHGLSYFHSTRWSGQMITQCLMPSRHLWMQKSKEKLMFCDVSWSISNYDLLVPCFLVYWIAVFNTNALLPLIALPTHTSPFNLIKASDF